MNKKQLTLISIVIMFLAILIYVNSSQLTKSKDADRNVKVSKSNMEHISNSVKVSMEDLKFNKDPSIQVGRGYLYKETTSLAREEDYYELHTHIVKNVERINKTNCYFIISNETKYLNMYVPENIEDGDFMTFTTCIKEDDGIPIFFMINNKSTEGTSASASVDTLVVMGKFFYAPWMLALDKDFKWNEEINISDPVEQQTKLEYQVLDIEKVNNIESFKVEIRINNKIGDKRTNLKSIVWIDTKERILVKAIIYLDNLRLRDITLLSEGN